MSLAMATPEEAKLQQFLQWLEVNRAELRGCRIKYSHSSKGFGVFSSNHISDGIPLVVPLDLAITPMRVLQDPLLGPECRAMFEEGEVDDRLLITLFLTVEHLRENSSWKPYFDMLPTTFGNPLWFSDDEVLELKGTTLYRATQLQRKTLQSLFDEKVKRLAEKLLTLDGRPERCSCGHHRANSIFWSRALNIPFPRCYVFPTNPEGQDSDISSKIVNSGTLTNDCGSLSNGESAKVAEHDALQDKVASAASVSQGEIVWVEGLVPGIDFCNHDFKAVATWEVDGTGATTGVPFSMYLLSAGENPCQIEKEISISYGDKGNEELLYLYGFVMNNNPEDYLMLVGSGGERQPTETEVQAAIWEACGDSGALQLLVDLLNMKMLDLEEGSGTEENDTELLEKACTREISEDCRKSETNGGVQNHFLSRNRWSSIIYRRGQKQLARLFLKEAEHALHLALTEEI
ncbi:uncharacterized protein LOC107795691 isoform X5 [Nicotiana tabacum]|uniref:Uncharacterized protein LOC107795691 isoform X5 n=1 Tax=Nicotiana tabacum TaxID=4097 RepID=A0AC58TAW5_TOBAC